MAEAASQFHNDSSDVACHQTQLPKERSSVTACCVVWHHTPTQLEVEQQQQCAKAYAWHENNLTTYLEVERHTGLVHRQFVPRLCHALRHSLHLHKPMTMHSATTHASAAVCQVQTSYSETICLKTTCCWLVPHRKIGHTISTLHVQ